MFHKGASIFKYIAQNYIHVWTEDGPDTQECNSVAYFLLGLVVCLQTGPHCGHVFSMNEHVLPMMAYTAPYLL